MARNRKRILGFARLLARGFARRQALGLCTADDVQLLLAVHGHDPAALGSTAGVVFRAEAWVPTRLRSPSCRPSNRRREIQVWQLAEAALVTPLRVAQQTRRGGAFFDRSPEGRTK